MCGMSTIKKLGDVFANLPREFDGLECRIEDFESGNSGNRLANIVRARIHREYGGVYSTDGRFIYSLDCPTEAKLRTVTTLSNVSKDDLRDLVSKRGWEFELDSDEYSGITVEYSDLNPSYSLEAAIKWAEYHEQWAAFKQYYWGLHPENAPTPSFWESLPAWDAKPDAEPKMRKLVFPTEAL